LKTSLEQKRSRPYGDSVKELSDTGAFEIDRLVRFFRTVFANDVRFKIIMCLANREGACLREIARDVGISHKNLSKYLDKFMHKGVVEAFPVGLRSRVYRLATKYDFLRESL
jgi:DNA-binding transcriptional ArsR family regulator